MTPRRRRILERFIATGTAKGCGVDESLVRRWVRDACEEYGCSREMLVLHLVQGPRKARAAPVSVPIWDGDTE